MTRILRYEEAINLPKQEDQNLHANALKLLRGGLIQLCKQKTIIGAIVYGSSIVGEHTLSSDIDVLIAVKDRDEHTVKFLKDFTRDMHAKTCVFIEIVCYSRKELRSGRHLMGETMVCNLKEQAALHPQNVIGVNPVDLLTLQPKSLLEFTEDFFLHSKFMLEAEYMWTPFRDPEGLLQTALNMPHRAGRKSISALQIRGIIPKQAMPDVRKPTIAKAVKNIYGSYDPAIPDLYRYLSADLHLYVLSLREVVRGNVTRKEYNQTIEATAQQDAPKAIALLGKMHKAFRHMYCKTTPTH